MRKPFGILAAFIAALVTSAASAQICPPSNVVDTDIGDGCSTEYVTSSNYKYFLPQIGAFKSTFTPACNGHDKCYSTIGTSSGQCDSDFLSSMHSACSSTYPPFLLPAVYSACVATADQYYAGVTANEIVNHPVAKYQEDALRLSVALATSVNNDQCGTTPQMTTLFAPSLINQINSAYQLYAHRLPTIYEFLDAVNANAFTANDVVQNPSAWNAVMVQKAIANAAFPPPVAAFTVTQGAGLDLNLTFNATQTSGSQYLWNLTYAPTSIGPTASVMFYDPTYAQTVTVSGYLKVTGSNGAKNMALFSNTYYLQGECNAKKGNPCR